MSGIVAWLAIQLGKLLFLPEPAWTLDDEKRRAFDQALEAMIEAPAGSAPGYPCPYPKWEYLRYLTRHKGMVLHGSNRGDIDVLRPQEQTDFSGRRITAVFGTRDAIWPLFFATLNTAGYRGSLRNGCWVMAARGGGQRHPALGGQRHPALGERRFYFFSVNRDRLGPGLWTEGTVYILPGDTFEKTDTAAVRFDEWASRTAVTPVARLAVQPGDFPFAGQVAGHREGEPMPRSWLCYKRRLRIRAAADKGCG